MKNRLRLVGGIAILLAGALILTNSVAPAGPVWINAEQPPVSVNPAIDTIVGDDRRPTLGTPSQPPPGSLPVSEGVGELRASGASMSLDPDGTIRSVSAPRGKDLAADADTFLRRFGGALGLTSSHTVWRASTVGVPGGDKVLRYQQQAAGLPVLGGEIVVTTSDSGAVRAAITDTTPLAPTSGAARLSADEAKAKGVEAAAKAFTLPMDKLRAEATLWLYDSATEQGGSARPELRPTYRVRFLDGDHEVATVLIDGITGETVLTASERRSVGGSRTICDLGNTPTDLNVLANYVCNPYSGLAKLPSARHEGAPASPVTDVNRAYDRLGNAANFFRTNFGRDSYDGRGAEIRATVRACHFGDCKFENAFWDGYQFVFGDGWATDDVAAHEFTHAVTEHSSTLLYWYQAGAINEALSDIFSELIDLSIHDDGSDDTTRRWQLAENIPTGLYFPTGGPIRHMRTPSLYFQPEAVYGGNWAFGSADNGGVHTNSGPANKAAVLIADGNGVTPGIGLTKSAHLWYRVMHLLPSGAGYATLMRTVLSACANLVGHHGFTESDCAGSVAAGVAPLQSLDQYSSTFCASAASADVFWRDDFEKGAAAWRSTSDVHWLRLPSPEVNQTYAFSGRGSMNGWNPTGGPGNGKSIEMINPVHLSIPRPQLNFAYSMINRGAVGAGVRMQINDGSGWVPLNGQSGDRISTATGGYTMLNAADLSAYYNKSVRLKFVLDLPTNAFIDWYLDDIALYSCDRNKPSRPVNAFGYHSGGGVQIGWDFGQYHTPPAQWDLSFSPAIPGAPTSIAFDGVHPMSIFVPGADPGANYKVTVTPRTGGLTGDPVEILVSQKAPLVCPSNSAPLSLPFVGSRSGGPDIPGAPCRRSLPPQRG